VVIPVRDRPIAAPDWPRLIVVDDGSRVPVPGALRLAVPGGPGAARNAALPHVTTELVAFLDSDCVPPADWIDRLAGHFADPQVAAVAPRVPGLLDLGTRPAEVGPGRRVAYVPTAALIVRKDALAAAGDARPPSGSAASPAGAGLFDPALRFGEDVDLIWRLADAGWRVRYDPRVVVRHDDGPRLIKQFCYGTSAAPLSQRHPERLAPLVLRPWPALAVALLLKRRPLLAAAATLAPVVPLRRRGVPTTLAAALCLRAAVDTWLATSRAVAQFTLPRPGMPATLANLAYGLGVYAGCVKHRTVRPLLPVLRTRARIGGGPTI
jgi:cellulose synthase/poly-beta-1,6-N-acetylglucosamine synthase-like glycosyltransferase